MPNTKRRSSVPERTRAMKLVALADYRQDSVVSREIVKKSAGTVTFFAFDKGQGLSEHTAPFDALVVVLDGEARISIACKWQRVKKGEMVIMPAHKPHALKAVKRFKMMLVMVRA